MIAKCMNLSLDLNPPRWQQFEGISDSSVYAADKSQNLKKWCWSQSSKRFKLEIVSICCWWWPGQEWATPEFSLQTNISLHSLIDLNIITLEHDWAEWTIKMRVLMMVSRHWSVSVMCLHSWPIITGFTRKHFTLSTSSDDDPRYNLIISLTSLNMSSWHWAYWSSQTPSPYLRCWHSRLMIMRIMMIEISLQPAMMITIYILDILLHACCRHVLKVAIKCKKILLLSIIDNHQTRVFNNNCYWRLSFNSCSRQ